MHLTFLLEVDEQEGGEFQRRYRVPTVDQIDPSFIHMHPAVMERSDFEALGEYKEPVEPRVIDAFDYRRQAELTAETAEGLIDTIVNRLDRQETVHDKVFEIMRSKRFRAGTVKQMRFEENRELFRPTVQAHVDAGTPLEFVLPSFPFKHRNPVKVGRRSPDMAELLCLCQLREICLALGRVHEPGARFLIICDGLVYREMFGVTRHEALAYRERVKEMIVQLGFGDTLGVADMEDLVESRRELFDFVEERLRPVFTEWWSANPEDLRRASLISASAANVNTSESVTHDLVQMATKDAVLGPDGQNTLDNFETIREQTVDRAERGAFEFALFLYVLREIDLVGSCYPGAVRATVHPKPGQWGLHLVNPESRVFPWQGVAYLNERGRWRMKYEFDVIRQSARPVHVGGDDELFPFYYEHRGGE